MKRNILCLETSSGLCSVALSTNEKALICLESSTPQSHSNLINSMIRDVMQQAGIEMKELDAIAISSGPGSYTGLRIGASVATGFAYGLDLPLIAVQSLRCMFNGFMNRQDNKVTNDLIYPLIDARRMEVYAAGYDSKGNEVMKPCALIIDESSFKEELDQRQIHFIGSGADKVQAEIKHANAHFYCQPHLSAKNLLPTAVQRFESQDFEDLAYWTPYYLKEHMTGAHRSKKLEL